MHILGSFVKWEREDAPRTVGKQLGLGKRVVKSGIS